MSWRLSKAAQEGEGTQIYTTEEILDWLWKERAYQRTIRRKAKSVGDEIEFAQTLLDEARAEWAVNKDPARQRVTMRCFRRIAANFVRSMEKYGVPNDQTMQLVREREYDEESCQKGKEKAKS